MAKKEKLISQSGTVIHVNLVSVVIFSIGLIAAAALVTYGLARHSAHDGTKTLSLTGPINLDSPDVEDPNAPASGQLILRPIELEQPEEYVAYETTTNR